MGEWVGGPRMHAARAHAQGRAEAGWFAVYAYPCRPHPLQDAVVARLVGQGDDGGDERVGRRVHRARGEMGGFCVRVKVWVAIEASGQDVAPKRVLIVIMDGNANAGILDVSGMRDGEIPLHLHRPADRECLRRLHHCARNALTKAAPTSRSVACRGEGLQLDALGRGQWSRRGDGEDAVRAREREKREEDKPPPHFSSRSPQRRAEWRVRSRAARDSIA